MSEQYPLNFDELEKGTWLDTDYLIKVLGCNPADGPKWNFALMGLCNGIEREASIVAHVSQDRIRLCDDAEACEYLTRGFNQALGKLPRYTARRFLIDREGLTSEQRDIAERRDRYLGAVTHAAHLEARKQRKLEKLIHRPTPQIEAESVE